ncbi:MAG TPA: SCO family protein [Steroidobacteraceae bacterium]|nr:SCO family protein [Steroidobacteraceae bacterium]
MNSSAPAAPRRRAIFFSVAAIFMLPLAIAIWLYYAPAAWRPAGSVNHGALIQPAHPLPALALPTMDGGATAADFLRHRWTLIYVGSGQCGARCHDALYQMRQVRLALNQDMDRVQRLFIATDPCCDREFLAREHPGLIVVPGNSAEAAELIALLPTDAGPAGDAGRIYFADPLGNLMMAHPRDSQPKELLEDLKRLLKLSQIG